MAPRKSERILNLTICLLAAPRFLTREQIREAVEGYAGLGQAAFERTFERDKEDLRELGVPVETGSNSAWDDEVGYRIRRTDFELPPIEFTPDEAAVVALAGQVWQQANLAESTQSALAKLRAAGLATDTERLQVSAPTLGAREAAFEPLYAAVVAEQRVAFDYRRGGAGAVARRTVDPWGVISHRGSWYLVGHDLDRDAARMFKLARILDTPQPVRHDDPFHRTEQDLRELVIALDPGGPRREALLGVRQDRAPWLRRRTTAAEPDPRTPEGFDTQVLGFTSVEDATAHLAELGADVVVLDPPDLRDAVVAHLEAVAR